MVVKGRSLTDGNPKTIEVTQNQIAEALMDSVEGIANGVKQALENTPPELVADIIDSGITLTGGGSLLANLTAVVIHVSGIGAQVADNPLDCVVLGTGKALQETQRKGSVLLKYY